MRRELRSRPNSLSKGIRHCPVSVIINLRVKQIYFPAQLSYLFYQLRIGSLHKSNPTPVLLYDRGKDFPNDVVRLLKILVRRIRLAEFLQPHLQVVQPVTAWEAAGGQTIINNKVRSSLCGEGLLPSCHGLRGRWVEGISELPTIWQRQTSCANFLKLPFRYLDDD